MGQLDLFSFDEEERMARRLEATGRSVSYTHLTLPTTPYV